MAAIPVIDLPDFTGTDVKEKVVIEIKHFKIFEDITDGKYPDERLKEI